MPVCCNNAVKEDREPEQDISYDKYFLMEDYNFTAAKELSVTAKTIWTGMIDIHKLFHRSWKRTACPAAGFVK